MHVPADRLRKLQELYSESFAFSINSRLPQTVLGQCIVSYRKFIDHLAHIYGFEIFDNNELPVTVQVLTRVNYRDKSPFGIVVNCLSIDQAIRVTRLALKRSTGDSFSAIVKIKNRWCTPPVMTYIAESRKVLFKQNCQVLSIKDANQKTSHH